MMSSRALRQASPGGTDRAGDVGCLCPGVAAQWGFEVVDEGAGRGETGAVELAVKVCRERGASSLAVIPGDIPLLTAADVDCVMHHGMQYNVVIVPSWDSRGTNAILLRPPDALQLRFGSWSFFPHVKQAKRKGLSYKVVRLPRIALDVDTPEDLGRLLPGDANQEPCGSRRNADISPLARTFFVTCIYGVTASFLYRGKRVGTVSLLSGRDEVARRAWHVQYPHPSILPAGEGKKSRVERLSVNYAV